MKHHEMKCKDRIKLELPERLEELKKIMSAYHGEAEKDSEYSEESLFEYGLSLQYVIPEKEEPAYLEYCLSYGGPADYWRFYCDASPRHALIKAEYVFQDWFDGATHEIDLYSESAQPLKELWNFMVEVETVEAEIQKALED